jgi:hypothetical protein
MARAIRADPCGVEGESVLDNGPCSAQAEVSRMDFEGSGRFFTLARGKKVNRHLGRQFSMAPIRLVQRVSLDGANCQTQSSGLGLATWATE